MCARCSVRSVPCLLLIILFFEMNTENEETYYSEESDISIGNNVSEEREIYIRTFIQFVYSNAYLYIKKSKGCSKSQDKFITWTTIGTAMIPKLTDLEAEKLFHRLRDKFGKERKKVTLSMPRSGAGAGTPMYQSNWIFYNDLLFLVDYIVPRKTTSSFQRPAVPALSPPSQDKKEFTASSFKKSFTNQPNSASSSTVPLDKPAISPTWNSDFNWLCSSSSCSLDSEITDTGTNITDTGTNMSCEIEGEEEKYVMKEASGSTTSATMLKAMAASIQPAKTVPPNDPVKKRKRNSEKTDEILSQSSKDISFLATSLGTALEKFGLQPVQPTPPRPKISSDIDAILGSIAVALSRVPNEEQISCVMDILAVVKEYIPKRSH